MYKNNVMLIHNFSIFQMKCLQEAFVILVSFHLVLNAAIVYVRDTVDYTYSIVYLTTDLSAVIAAACCMCSTI